MSEPMVTLHCVDCKDPFTESRWAQDIRAQSDKLLASRGEQPLEHVCPDCHRDRSSKAAQMDELRKRRARQARDRLQTMTRPAVVERDDWHLVRDMLGDGEVQRILTARRERKGMEM